MYFSEYNSPAFLGHSQTNSRQMLKNDLNAEPAIDAVNGNNTNNNIIKFNNNNDNNINKHYNELTINRENCGFISSKASCDDSNSFSKKRSMNGAKVKSNDNKKEIYMVAEGYHKTNSCYYKTPDGGYHKLPPDSYHKMSEICYNKLPDGSFKRLVDKTDSSNTLINGSVEATNTGSQNKVRNHMIKFLKRSKSHSQATAKESYISYRKENQQLNAKGKEINYQEPMKNNNIVHQNMVLEQENVGTKSSTYTNNTGTRNSTSSGSRKVVVTMMENGGLPIVATSKTKSTKNEYKPHHQNFIRDKVKLD